MSKTIKVIDLLNKIANREELPKKILILDEVYYLITDEDGDIVYSQLKDRREWEGFIDHKLNITRCLHEDVIILDEVEIIEEQEEIDIQSIEEKPKILFLGTGKNYLMKVLNDIIDNQNLQLQAVKQLEKKIKEKG